MFLRANLDRKQETRSGRPLGLEQGPLEKRGRACPGRAGARALMELGSEAAPHLCSSARSHSSHRKRGEEAWLQLVAKECTGLRVRGTPSPKPFVMG